MTLFPEQNQILINRSGEEIHTTLTVPEPTRQKAPLLIILHGFKGFRNYSFFPWMAQYAATQGMIAVRFCFSRNGMNGTSWLVQDPAAFARNTISHEADDVHDVVQLIREHANFASIREQWDGRLFLIGHSRGGGIAQIVARELQAKKNVDLVRTAALNSVGTWVRWTPRQREEWVKAGFITVLNERTKQELRMEMSYLNDIEQNNDRLSLDQAARSLGTTLAYIHSGSDLTVPIVEIRASRVRTATEAPFIIIPNTTHTFGMTHPVDRITRGFVDAMHASFSWLLQ